MSEHEFLHYRIYNHMSNGPEAAEFIRLDATGRAIVMEAFKKNNPKLIAAWRREWLDTYGRVEDL